MLIQFHILGLQIAPPAIENSLKLNPHPTEPHRNVSTLSIYRSQ